MPEKSPTGLCYTLIKRKTYNARKKIDYTEYDGIMDVSSKKQRIRTVMPIHAHNSKYVTSSPTHDVF